MIIRLLKIYFSHVQSYPRSGLFEGFRGSEALRNHLCRSRTRPQTLSLAKKAKEKRVECLVSQVRPTSPGGRGGREIDKMGETLGIAHNVFEKVAREKDRKERLKKFDEWQKIKLQKQKKIEELKKLRNLEASNGSLAMPEDLDDPIYDSEEGLDMLDMSGSPIRPPRSPRMTSTSLKSLGSRGASVISLDIREASHSAASNTSLRKLTAKPSIDMGGLGLGQRQDSVQHNSQDLTIEPPLAFSKIDSTTASASNERSQVELQSQPRKNSKEVNCSGSTKEITKLKCGCHCEIL